jgi:hypothetical protein
MIPEIELVAGRPAHDPPIQRGELDQNIYVLHGGQQILCSGP